MAVSPPSASTEVVIVGGGPAGASAARLLSTWGHSVVLLAREPRRPPLGESLPPSVRKLFGLLEIQGDIDLGGFYPTTGNTVWWGEGEVRSESFAGGATGNQVQRSDFDRLLLGLAEEAGADVRRGADVRAIEGLELPPPARSREAGEGAAQGPAGGSEPISVRRPRGNPSTRSGRTGSSTARDAQAWWRSGAFADSGTAGRQWRWPVPGTGKRVGGSTSSRIPWSRATATDGPGRYQSPRGRGTSRR